MAEHTQQKMNKVAGPFHSPSDFVTMLGKMAKHMLVNALAMVQIEAPLSVEISER
jgi:hypothetical protein